MPELLGKPYVHLFEPTNSVDPKILSVAVQCTTIAYNAQQLQNNTLIVKYNITTNGTNIDRFPGDVSLPAGSYTKVVVRLYDGPALKGSCTIPVLNPVAYEATNYKIYCYIKSLPSARTRIYFYVNMKGTGFALPANPTEITLLPNQNKIVLNYDEAAGTADATNRNCSLENYDITTYNTVEVALRNNPTRKGKGTTTQSDADSSGDN